MICDIAYIENIKIWDVRNQMILFISLCLSFVLVQVFVFS